MGIFLLYFPPIDGSGLRREVATYQMEVLRTCLVFPRITFVLDLLDDRIGGAIELEFEDVDVVGGLYDTIHSAFALLFLYEYGVGAYHAKDEIESILEVTLLLSLIVLATLGIWDACQKGREELL